MKKFYAHYTFIYPNTFLRDHIVELDNDERITSFYPFTKEIANTEFHSGLQIFIPKELSGKISNDDLLRLEPLLDGLLDDALIRSFSI